MNKFLKRAFTLVELLIVIGVIGVLAVILLVTLNPAEAQRKARDVKRIKDAGTLQVIMEQAIADNLIAACSVAPCITLGVTSGTARETQDVCGDNPATAAVVETSWLTLDVCPYAKNTPMDPLNGYTGNVANVATNVPGGAVTFISASPQYRVVVSGIDYEINVRQESSGNATKMAGDGGNSGQWFEIASNLFTLYGD